jgi:hypothetical protein
MAAVEERTLQNDLNFGLKNEIEVCEILKTYFKDESIEKTKEQFCSYDFKTNSNMKYELKTRRFNFNKYPTTIIPVHKCKDKDEICFVFKFTDGIYFIYYDADLFSTFKTKSISVFRNGYWNPSALHYEIPIDILIRINI